MGELLRSVFNSPGEAAEILSGVHRGNNELRTIEIGKERFTVPISEIGVARIEKALIEAYTTGVVVNPDEVVKEKGASIYEDMLRLGGHLYAVCDTLLGNAAGITSRIVPGDLKNPVALEHAAFIEEVFSRFQFVDNLKQIYYADLMGVSVCEKVMSEPFKWRGKDKQGIKFFDRIEMDRITFDLKGNPRLLTQRDQTQGVALPKWKYIVMKMGNGYYGDARLKHAYPAYWFKRNASLFLVKYLERWGDPALVGYHGNDAEKAQVLAMLENIRSSTTASLPATMKELTILQPSRDANFIPALQYWDDEISKVIAGATRQMSGSTAAGAFSATETHNEEADDRVRILTLSGKVIINEQIIKPLIDFNFGKQEVYPYYETGAVEKESPSDYLDNLNKVKTSGVKIGLSKIEFYEKSGFTKPETPEDTMEIMPDAAMAGGGTNFSEGSSSKKMNSPEQKTRSHGTSDFSESLKPRRKAELKGLLRSTRETQRN